MNTDEQLIVLADLKWQYMTEVYFKIYHNTCNIEANKMVEEVGKKV